jgi:septum formation inhibitor-activating ATPase MinD
MNIPKHLKEQYDKIIKTIDFNGDDSLKRDLALLTIREESLLANIDTALTIQQVNKMFEKASEVDDCFAELEASAKSLRVKLGNEYLKLTSAVYGLVGIIRQSTKSEKAWTEIRDIQRQKLTIIESERGHQSRQKDNLTRKQFDSEVEKISNSILRHIDSPVTIHRIFKDMGIEVEINAIESMKEDVTNKRLLPSKNE